jgi:protein phosphatase 2C family protein 2/3
MGQSSGKAARSSLQSPPSQKRRHLSISEASIQGRRRTQEDRHVALESLEAHPEIALFGVFDGHNGDACAEYCRSHLYKRISSKINKGVLTPNALRQAFIDTDDAFLAQSQATPLDAGCTAVVTVYNRVTGTLITANCGDARCLVSHGGVAEVLTVDHKPDVPSEKQRIEAAGRLVRENRLDGCLAVSRALGDLSLKREYDAESGLKRVPPERFALTPVPHIVESHVTPEHNFIVLACDGLFDVMSNQEVVDWITARLKEDEAAEAEAKTAALPSSSSSTAEAKLLDEHSDPAPAVEEEEPDARNSHRGRTAKPDDEEPAEEAGSRRSRRGRVARSEEEPRRSRRQIDTPDDRQEEEDERATSPSKEADKDDRKEVQTGPDHTAINAAISAAVQRTLEHQSRKNKSQKKKDLEKLKFRVQTLSTRPNRYRDDSDVPPPEPVKKRSDNIALDLAEHAMEIGSMDNISVIIILLERPTRRRSGTDISPEVTTQTLVANTEQCAASKTTAKSPR